MVSLHKKLSLRNSVEGRERKLDGAAKKVGRLCVHVRILCAFLPVNFKEQAGRSQGFHNHVHDPWVVCGKLVLNATLSPHMHMPKDCFSWSVKCIQSLCGRSTKKLLETNERNEQLIFEHS
jgi:hypothetical protein